MSTKPEASLVPLDAPVDLGKRYFTLDLANRALPYVRRIVGDVREVYGRIVALRRQIEQHARGAEALEREYEQAMDRLSYLVDEIHSAGAELKDFERGLVDFPAMHEGREVLLCWHSGEAQITHWHEAAAGFAGRRPVAELQS